MQKRGLSSKLLEELTLCSRGWRRTKFARCLTPWRQANTHVCGLDSRAVAQEKISKGHGICDPKRSLRFLVDLFDPLFQGLDSFVQHFHV
jgi:hypothetical protein